MKEEPLWADLDEVIKEEPLKVKLPPSIHLKQTPKISNVTSMAPNPQIRIRTPASINEKVVEVPKKTLKFVPKLPIVIPAPPTPQKPDNQHIQELSKRLSKAILIRRVKKSDGSFINERSPIKIIQGMKISKLPQKSAQPAPPTVRQPAYEKRVTPIFRCSHCAKAFSVNKRRNAHEKFCFKNPTRPSSQCPFCPMVNLFNDFF